MIYVLYSTDYELFLGANHAPEKEILIDPTEELLAACEALDAPLNIFCDIACLWRYRELGEHQFPDMAEAQLKGAVARGHDVQTHLHPHWLKARRRGPAWDYPAESFLLGNHGDAAALLRRAKEDLEKLLRPVDDSYRCLAYRAGGFGLQPGEKTVLAALQSAGYAIDSSIVPGMVMNSAVNRIDFSRVPREPVYRLSPATGLDAPADDGLFEIPIPAARLGLASVAAQIAEKISCRLRGEEYPWLKRGQSAQDARPAGPPPTLAQKLRKAARRWFPLELRFRPQLMLLLTEAYVKDMRTNHPGKDIYFSVLSHSKTLSRSMLDSLAAYHRGLTDRYGTGVQAITYQEAARRLGGAHG